MTAGETGVDVDLGMLADEQERRLRLSGLDEGMSWRRDWVTNLPQLTTHDAILVCRTLTGLQEDLDARLRTPERTRELLRGWAERRRATPVAAWWRAAAEQLGVPPG